ncbi:hypothetical protein ILYODFUR_015940, partial [Ilyodon furcidens]
MGLIEGSPDIIISTRKSLSFGGYVSMEEGDLLQTHLKGRSSFFLTAEFKLQRKNHNGKR